MKRHKCKDCALLDTDQPPVGETLRLYTCTNDNGLRTKDFPACAGFVPRGRLHNDDVNMFSKTDVHDDGGE